MTREVAILAGCVLLASAGVEAADEVKTEAAPTFRIHLDPGHPWRPPFGLDRVGRPLAAIVEASVQPTKAQYSLTALLNGKEVGRKLVSFSTSGPPFTVDASFEGTADELVLSSARSPGAERTTLATEAIRPADIEADAVARPDTAVNPIDLGTILVPNGWLLLGPDQAGVVDVAVFVRSRDVPGARVRTWFESIPRVDSAADISLRQGRRSERHLLLPSAPKGVDRDTLHVSVDDANGRRLWHKIIPVMLVHTPPHWPSFGATATKLRFDAPISVRDPKTGTFSSMKYEDGWDPRLNDVVVSFPNGARYVFWRGSSYIPFWAGRFNTGACYEWAEILSSFRDAVDCVEPLMDKELRYGRVEIVESTAARVHVRWTYQSTDLHYKVWGDSAIEDYYFYPDGYGTRVLTLKSDPEHDYELSEFIVLTSQGTYPFSVLPSPLVDALFVDGRKHEFPFPYLGDQAPYDAPDQPAVYRLRIHKDDPSTAVYFNPNEKRIPPVIFGPFYDRGQMVTPCYWGSHWPLARGNATGSKIDDRIQLTPTHNSVMSWARTRPTPLRTNQTTAVDTLGRSKQMVVREWAWLIGMTDAPDASVLARARSFARPPSVTIQGGQLDAEPYSAERRAHRFRVDAQNISIRIRGDWSCVNPVFELSEAPHGLIHVTVDGRTLDRDQFVWDGRILWLDATLGRRAEVGITFADLER